MSHMGGAWLAGAAPSYYYFINGKSLGNIRERLARMDYCAQDALILAYVLYRMSKQIIGKVV